MRCLPSLGVSLVAAGLFGCGSSSASADAGPDAQAQPPTWLDAPLGAQSIGQGQTRTYPVTTSSGGGDVSAAVTDAAALEATLSADGKSLEVHAGYEASGAQQITLTLTDASGAHATAALSLDVKPLVWAERTSWAATGPEAREHGALIYDEGHDRTLLIAGSGYSPYLTPLGDTWAFDLTSSTWSKLTPGGDAISAGGSKRVAQLPGQSIAYLWGGYGADQASVDELVRVDFSGDQPSFKLLTQVGTPPPRSLHAFAYDPGSDRFFLFGGVGFSLYGDTWTMTLDGDTATWTEITPALSPSARYGFFYGVDQERGQLVLYSGAQGTNPLDPAQDTWVLDLRASTPGWTKVRDGAGDGVPPGRRNGCAVWDPGGPRLFVFGGTADAQTTESSLFAFDARPGKPAWTQLDRTGEPPLRSSGIGFHDQKRDRTLFGFGNTTSAVYRDLTPLGY